MFKKQRGRWSHIAERWLPGLKVGNVVKICTGNTPASRHEMRAQHYGRKDFSNEGEEEWKWKFLNSLAVSYVLFVGITVV